mmetsp:Transcript_55130/g.135231  ORF Transcript_55130/g.135231 Transcript_55130/m.135231 type:complete len:80 (-) Transcript_55130:109-348(-)|eukprot:CAMPEP_0198369078 /NCGR_PEP_ID=MMETSP1450-20131203/155995_1 /TAXON_ID=753684 ORGANISM="Madagascaria erythrocladiodes, Strain CCMP3234" /NCGR_SAMPLE_ID=MMETSP1450 /ASSEMBLY_ACC=CAM_ASM_001115 /LENGTH=79 /DNA_ID=CAMNT_0044076595 /DNA_START=751 /DNA_END=990 /DNA_ORIENTATION=+
MEAKATPLTDSAPSCPIVVSTAQTTRALDNEKQIFCQARQRYNIICGRLMQLAECGHADSVRWRGTAADGGSGHNSPPP